MQRATPRSPARPARRRLPSIAGVLALAVGALLPGAAGTAELAAQAVAHDTTLYAGMKYRSIGPYRGGRSTAVAGVPGEPFTYLFGGTGGGVWKTTDAGESWTPLTDGQLGSGSIGAIRVAESDPAVVYVGTGSACPRGNVSQGDGMYRSEDGGKTWRHIGLPESGAIGRIAVHPRDPDVAFAAALGHLFGPNPERGVYRTTDGGESWERVLFISDSTGAVDVAMNPANPRIVFAGMWRAERKPWNMISGAREGGIWRTVDGGDTWERLGGGLPDGLVGKTAVTVSPADPERVWVLIEAPGDEGGVYRSDDGGDTWTQVNKDRKLLQRAWYYTHIYADPKDENTVYALNTDYYRSVDGGKTWQEFDVPHGDVHDLWIYPDDPDKQVVANDGGAQVTLNGARSWSTMYAQPTAEFYRVFVDNQFPYRVYGPQQDNSTISVPSRGLGGIIPTQHWYSVGGCESGHIAFDPDDPGTTYAGCYGGAIDRTDTRTGLSQNVLVYPQLQLGQPARELRYRFQWNAPIRLSPQDPDVLYHASQHVHRSTDGGSSWETISPDLTRDIEEYQGWAGEPITKDNTGVEVYGTIFAFEPSPFEAGVLWAGSDDGRVHISRDDGETWTEITPGEGVGMPREGTVNTIELSPHGEGRAFLAVYNYRVDDFTPYMFRTDDYGQSWTRLSNEGIADDHFVRVVREDPERQGLLYAGTEYGMYVSFDDGRSWQSLQLNLPTTPITDLRVHRGDLVVATQGRSFWILDDLSPLRQASDEIAGSSAHLLEPASATRARFGGFRADERGPENPPSGAILYYWLAEEPSDMVRIEILDEGGNVIRTYASRPRGEAGDEGAEPALSAEQERRDVDARPDSIPAKAGLNRASWDLRGEEPDLVDDAVVWGYTGGAPVVPGTYRVRFTAADVSQTRDLEVRGDPRVETTAEQYRRQHEVAVRLRDMLQEAHDAIRRIRSVRSQAKERAEAASRGGFGEEFGATADSIAEALTAVEEELTQTKSESRQDPLNFPPMLDNQIVYAYGYVLGGDYPPTAGAAERADDLREQLDGHLAELSRILEGPVAELNRDLQQAGVPAVVVAETK